MIYLKSKDEIELIRQSNLLVSRTLAELAKYIKPGVRTIDLDKMAEQFIRDNGAEPAFLNYNGFPNSLCISVNDAVVHGIPSDQILVDGDIVSIDCGVISNGFYGDSAYTFPVGTITRELGNLLRVTKESLFLGIKSAIEGNRIGDIGYSIQNYVQGFGYSVVREMTGHGIGRQLHEDPVVPNYGKRGRGTMLRAGMVIAIEPMINMGKRDIYIGDDNWTVKTSDHFPSAHYEHTIAITNNEADILSCFDFIETV